MGNENGTWIMYGVEWDDPGCGYSGQKTFCLKGLSSMDVNEKDWKLFRKYLPDWQENYMEKLIKDYIEFLKGDGLASDKFWELEKKIKADRKNPGVLLQDVRRSNFHVHLASLVGYEVISMKDLDGFSDETKEIVERMVR